MATASLDTAHTIQLLREAQGRIEETLQLLRASAGETAPDLSLSARDRARVDSVGEVAWRHRQYLAEHGRMTVADSKTIRREIYGDNIRSTANLFGTAGSGAVFHRTTPYGTRPNDNHEVRLTQEGERLADLWELLHER